MQATYQKQLTLARYTGGSEDIKREYRFLIRNVLESRHYEDLDVDMTVILKYISEKNKSENCH
jgi:hypothetical protein